MNNNNHPLTNWFRKYSGWCFGPEQLPEEALSEGQLMIDTWNAAIKQAINCSEEGNGIVLKSRLEGLLYQRSGDVLQ